MFAHVGFGKNLDHYNWVYIYLAIRKVIQIRPFYFRASKTTLPTHIIDVTVKTSGENALQNEKKPINF